MATVGMTRAGTQSTSWGNYSDDSFSPNANGRYTGAYEQAKAIISMIWLATTGSGRRSAVAQTTSCAAVGIICWADPAPVAAILQPSATRYLAIITIPTSASAWLCSSL